MKLYFAVSADEYELPIAVCESVKEMARAIGMTENAVMSAVSRRTSGRNTGIRLMAVDMDDEGEDEDGASEGEGRFDS